MDTHREQLSDPGYPAADGLAWKVTGPPNAFKKFNVVANKDGSCTEEAPCQGTQDWGGFGSLVPTPHLVE